MPSPQRQPRPSSFRPDVEGLRAVAIVAVLLCHAGLATFAGGYVGVDVFFVISGFLITGLLLRELESEGGVSLGGFYARRARRLLPLLALVLLVVVAASLLLFSPVRAQEASGDVVSSALYVANWHFAAGSVDYFSQGLEPSPVQHLWSLAIEEQFYLVWPLLLIGVTWFQRRRGGPVRPVLWATVAAVGLASLAYGIHITDAEPKAAYFSTFARAWELALGAALALLGARRLPGLLAAALGWAGLAAIVYAALAFDERTAFPGLAALVPTLGVAALILAGSAALSAPSATAARLRRPAAGRLAPARLLSLAPVRYVGRVSYSWYLWHWPAIVFAVALWGALSPLAGLAVVAVSFLPAAVSHHALENPVRRARSLALRPRRALALGLACVAVTAIAGSVLGSAQPGFRTAPVGEVRGALALEEQPLPQERADAVRPNPMRAREDRSQMYEDGCLVGLGGTELRNCVYGDPASRRTVFLFGDSHAMQYFPAVRRIANARGWKLVPLTKTECTPAAVPVRSETEGREYSECEAWRERALQRIEAAGRGATVLMSGATEYEPLAAGGDTLDGGERAEALEHGYLTTLDRIHRAGLRAAVIKDPPAAAADVPSCVSRELQNLDACAFRRVRDEADEFDARAAERAPGVHLIDVTNEICPGEICRAVIGNALVYRDRTHLSATFARTLAPGIERGLEEAGLT
jgi:peptidoglycan/LPS O-acetylase OafA/YrhL